MKGAFGVSIENGIVMIGDTDMYYVRFGERGRKNPDGTLHYENSYQYAILKNE